MSDILAMERYSFVGDRMIRSQTGPWVRAVDAEQQIRELRAELESAADREATRIIDRQAHRDFGQRHAALVALVREWQEARKPAILSAPGEFLAETFQAAVRRMSVADEALAGYRIDGPDETETCETCLKPITGRVVWSWDDVPMCEECAEPDQNNAPTDGGPSLRDELAEIIRWRFKTADGDPMNGPLILKRAQEIADEIAPMIEEATGER